MTRPDPLRPAHTFRMARFVRATAGRVALALFRVRFLGVENVPVSGAILAGNHVSYGDPVLLWCGAPRRVHFMAKSELWRTGWLGWALDRLWAFPVVRGTPDREAIQTATALLSAGELVGIFPEGTRNRDGSAEAQQGVAFIAMRAGVPVVPVGIAGTDEIRPAGSRRVRFPRIVIAFGEPIDPAMFGSGGRRERVESMTAEVMRRIAAQLGEARAARQGS